MNVGAITGIGQPPPAVQTSASADANNQRRELVRAVESVSNARVFGENSEVTFSLDRQTHRPLIRIVDRETHEVIQQIPAEYVIQLAESLKAAAPRA